MHGLKLIFSLLGEKVPSVNPRLKYYLGANLVDLDVDVRISTSREEMLFVRVEVGH